MNYLEYVKDNTIIICNNDKKKAILKSLSDTKKFLNVVFYTEKEFIRNYLFKVKDEALEYITSKYNLNIDVSKMYLGNIYYVCENINYNNKKLDKLVSIKKDLIDNGFIIYNNLFKSYIKNFNILVLKDLYIDEYILNIYREVNAQIIEPKKIYEIKECYLFDSITEEVRYVFKKISELIKKGIDINNIKVCNLDDTYNNLINRFSEFYGIVVNVKNNNTLYGNIIGKKFLDNLNLGLEKDIESIKNYDKDIVNKIINVVNKYNYVDEYNIKKYLMYEFKNTKIENFNYKNYIDIVDITYPFCDNDYVFLMNFNMGSIPKYVKDEDYITDNIKDKVNMFKTDYINKEIKINTINIIKSIKNLTITYKLKGEVECYPSSLISELDLNVINTTNDIYESFSEKDDLIIYASYLDLYNKYGDLNNNLFAFYNTYNDIGYGTYDNKFSGLDTNSLKEYLSKGINLSYSSLSNYNKCAFRYYIENILKFSKYEDTFEAYLGSLFHYVLEKCFNNSDLNVEDVIKEFLVNNEKCLNSKEEYFIEKCESQINFVLNVLNERKMYTSLDKNLVEKYISIKIDEDNNVNLVGIVDKILYKEYDDKTIVSIIDYKTGDVLTDLTYLDYGIGLQLPLYLYLVKKSNLFNNPRFAGFYINYIINSNNNSLKNKTLEEKMRDNLKLVGYSNDDTKILCEFDNNYFSSELVMGLKTKSDGSFYKSSKVLSDSEIDDIILEVHKVVSNNAKDILNGIFTINPKKIGYSDDYGCKYCKFRDLCFKKENDYVIIEKRGESSNAEVD